MRNTIILIMALTGFVLSPLGMAEEQNNLSRPYPKVIKKQVPYTDDEKAAILYQQALFLICKTEPPPRRCEPQCCIHLGASQFGANFDLLFPTSHLG